MESPAARDSFRGTAGGRHGVASADRAEWLHCLPQRPAEIMLNEAMVNPLEEQGCGPNQGSARLACDDVGRRLADYAEWH
jgi:hypothetical protein